MIVPDLKNFNKRQLGERYIEEHYNEFYWMLKKKYNTIENHKERLYLYIHDMSEPHRCPMCGKYTRFVDGTKGYSNYCSSKCSNSDPEKIQKQRVTTLEHYGVENPSQSEVIKKRKEETAIKNYGVPHPSTLESIKSKIKQTILERYGYENYSNRKKAKLTKLEKYGDENYTNREKCSKTLMERYGVKYAVQLEKAAKYNKVSKPNKKFAELLEKYNIEFSIEYPIENYKYDFKVGNILIEINPSVTHNSSHGPFGRPGISNMYHRDKLNVANKYNYKCINLWDWDDKYKIVNVLMNKEDVDISKCVLCEVNKDDTDEFLDTYHFHNTCENQDVRIGLYYEEELVKIMTFKKLNDNEWELLRMASCGEYNIINGYNTLFKYFLNTYNPKSIISYCDLSKFTGDEYINLGFTLYKEEDPVKHWSKRKTEFITNNEHEKNKDALLNDRYLDVYDCGYNIYTYKKEEA